MDGNCISAIYRQVGDYFILNLILPDDSDYQIGKYGRLRRNYLKEHRKICIPSNRNVSALCYQRVSHFVDVLSVLDGNKLMLADILINAPERAVQNIFHSILPVGISPPA